VPSFNDDVQGTSAVTLAGVYAAERLLRVPVGEMRFVLAGAGAAGVGIARLLRRALADAGASAEVIASSILVLDSRGLVHTGRSDLDEWKAEVAIDETVATRYGLDPGGAEPASLLTVVHAVKPHVLVGTTGRRGSFDEAVIRALAAGTDRPVVLALSNPSSRVEAEPGQVMEWSDGRAIVATGSPFPTVDHRGRSFPVGQANNVFVFPGLGLGTIVSEARSISEGMFLAAARAVAAETSDGRLADGALYPPVRELGRISRAVAIAVASEATRTGLAGIAPDVDLAAEVEAAMWWPTYAPYEPA
jgi:malic enzyme